MRRQMKNKLLALGICLILFMGCEEGAREDYFDLDGNPISKVEFQLNRETGTIVVYYENGNKKAAITIVKGDPKREIEWYNSGQKRIERVYTESFSDWKDVTPTDHSPKKERKYRNL